MKFFAWSFFVAGIVLMHSGLSASAAPPSDAIGTPIQALVTGGDVYLPGTNQMVAPARTSRVILHPEGRYALIVQNEVALPPSASLGEPETGAIALLLYDARLNKTKTLWECRADGMDYRKQTLDAQWLVGTDCAVATTSDTQTAENRRTFSQTSTLLLFNFEKSLSGRTLLTSPNALRLSLSPLKPVYVLEETIESDAQGKSSKQIRMGDARGTLGPAVSMSRSTFVAHWGTDADTLYAVEFVRETPRTPDAKPKLTMQWHEWTGQGAALTPLQAEPSKARFARQPAPPVLPFTARTVSLPVPPLEKESTPAMLHPLYLEATEAAPGAINRSLLLAPDADKVYLLADKSAVLYESKGALYAVPLVHLKSEAFAQAQKEAYKQAALRKARAIGMGILMYAETHNDTYPPPVGFAITLTPYLGVEGMPSGFTYVFTPGAASGLPPEKTTMGYLSGQGGRAVVYADGHVVWEDNPQNV